MYKKMKKRKLYENEFIKVSASEMLYYKKKSRIKDWSITVKENGLKGINLKTARLMKKRVDGIHLPHPFHLIVSFEPLRNTCLLSQLLYQFKKETFALQSTSATGLSFLEKRVQ